MGKKLKFDRGYNTIYDKVDRGAKYVMSCFNCGHYYQAKGDKKEVCQCSDVIEYDMMINEGRICCLHWIPPQIKRGDFDE